MRTVRSLSGVISLFLGAISIAEAGAPAGGYAVVVSKATREAPGWGDVVQALKEHYDAPVIEYDGSVDKCLPRLRDVFPRYTCFVARPEEADRAFVAHVHQLTRRLDDDPYTDTIWGILTGIDAESALRIARHHEPLTIRRVAAGTEIALECCQQGECFDELHAGHHVEKSASEQPHETTVPTDTTEAIVDCLNKGDVGLFVTSGHATERDWQIGYAYRNGQFRSKDGELTGIDTKGDRHPVHSTNPKVYMAVGNCLMGHVDGPDAMALAWLKSASVHQMIGYTVTTWYGYAGWGCLDYFVEQPGRFTLAEAFHANGQALIHRLEDQKLSTNDRQGLLYDRDVLAFYGDPAWEARMAKGPCAWEQTLTEREGIYTLTIHCNRGADTFLPINTNGSQRGNRPIIQYFPHRLTDVRMIDDSALSLIITDDFVLVRSPGPAAKRSTYQIVFRARPVAR